MENIKEQIETIVNTTIKQNGWKKLTSEEYIEFLKVTEIGKLVIFKGKSITGAEVTDVLEEIGICKRENERIILIDKGKLYGRYAISICLSTNNPIVTDKGYAKYKMEVKELIEKFLLENPQFIENKQKERDTKINKTRNLNKEKIYKEETRNG